MKSAHTIFLMLLTTVLVGCDFLPWHVRNKRGHTALAVRLEMQHIDYAITYYRLSSGKWPWGTNAPQDGRLEPRALFRVISDFNSTNNFFVKNSRWTEARSFVDPWGQDYRIQVTWDSSGLQTHSNATIQVWSCGKNKRDDNGLKDDMVLQP